MLVDLIGRLVNIDLIASSLSICSRLSEDDEYETITRTCWEKVDCDTHEFISFDGDCTVVVDFKDPPIPTPPCDNCAPETPGGGNSGGGNNNPPQNPPPPPPNPPPPPPPPNPCDPKYKNIGAKTSNILKDPDVSQSLTTMQNQLSLSQNETGVIIGNNGGLFTGNVNGGNIDNSGDHTSIALNWNDPNSPANNEVVATIHSHTEGTVVPSPTDISNMIGKLSTDPNYTTTFVVSSGGIYAVVIDDVTAAKTFGSSITIDANGKFAGGYGDIRNAATNNLINSGDTSTGSVDSGSLAALLNNPTVKSGMSLYRMDSDGNFKKVLYNKAPDSNDISKTIYSTGDCGN